MIIEPTLAQMAENFSEEMVKWSAAGFKIVNRSLYKFRLDACKKCEYWDDHSRLGYGKCNAPKAPGLPSCGCGRGKQWLSTAQCPLNRWEERTPKLP